LAADIIDAAECRAAALGVGADRVLIAAGELSEEAYLRALGDVLGVEFEPLDAIPRGQCPLNDERLIESAAGILPLAVDDDLYLVVAPSGAAARQILRLIEENPARARRFRFTNAERLNRFVLRYAGKTLAARASGQLKRGWPLFSAGAPRWLGNIVPLAIVGLLSFAAVVLARTLSARRRALRLGKDRARAGQKLAASCHYDAVARRAGALSQRAQGIRRPADARPRPSRKHRRPAAALPRRRVSLSGAATDSISLPPGRTTDSAADRPPLPRACD
jgi:hypothetical protein